MKNLLAINCTESIKYTFEGITISFSNEYKGAIIHGYYNVNYQYRVIKDKL